jgi:hypothetical protein
VPSTSTYSSHLVAAFSRSCLSLICLIAIFGAEVFFSFVGLFGIKYEGLDSSPVFAIYIAVIFILVFAAHLLSYAIRPRLTIGEAVLYCFFAFLLTLHFLWVIFDPLDTDPFPSTFILFLGIGIPGFMAARVIYAFNMWSDFIRLSELLFISMAAAISISCLLPFLKGDFLQGLSGASYQTASYYSSLCFGMIGTSLFCLPERYRFKFCSSALMIPISIILLIAMAAVCLLNGGRGGFLTILLYVIAFACAGRGSKKSIRHSTAYITFISLAFIAFLFIQYQSTLFSGDLLIRGWNRATSFLGGDSGLLNFADGSSGRDEAYASAFISISESPLIGYGPFAHWDKALQPHNLFLDLLLQFGLPVGSIVSFLLVFFSLSRIKPFIRSSPGHLWLVMLSIYPLVLLVFSSGYFINSVFLFCLTSFCLVDL